MNLLPLGFAFSGHEFGMLFALASMLLGLLIAALGMYFSHRRQVLWHETARIALEKGQPIPGDPDENTLPVGIDPLVADELRQRERRRGHITAGLLCLAVGAGLFFALCTTSMATARFAAIPGFIGVAFLLTGVVETWMARNSMSGR